MDKGRAQHLLITEKIITHIGHHCRTDPRQQAQIFPSAAQESYATAEEGSGNLPGACLRGKICPTGSSGWARTVSFYTFCTGSMQHKRRRQTQEQKSPGQPGSPHQLRDKIRFQRRVGTDPRQQIHDLSVHAGTGHMVRGFSGGDTACGHGDFLTISKNTAATTPRRSRQMTTGENTGGRPDAPASVFTAESWRASGRYC